MIWLLLGTAIVLALLDTAGFAPIRRARASALTIGRPIAGFVSLVHRPISTAWNGIVHYDDVEEENRALRHRVAALEGQTSSERAAAIDLRALLEASELSYVSDTETVTTRVVTDRRTASTRIVEIDKGSNHGLREAMPVVTGAGLVGQLAIVSANQSTVLLLTSDDLAVGVRSGQGIALTVGERSNLSQRPDQKGSITNEQLAGPVAGSKPSELEMPAAESDPERIGPPNQAEVMVGGLTQGRTPLALELSPRLRELHEQGDLLGGSLFVTSGLNNSSYPPGIPVGYLRDGQAEPTIDSAADLTQLNYLSVLLFEADS